MILKFNININSSEALLSLDYRGSVLALFKNAIKSLDEGLYKEYYGSNKTKLFSWSLVFPKGSKFIKAKNSFVVLPFKKSLLVKMTFENPKDCFLFNSALQSYKDKGTFLGYEYELSNFKLAKQVIKSHALLLKTCSNIAVIKHINKRDKYVQMSSPEYFETIKRNLYYKLNAAGREDLTNAVKDLAINLSDVKETTNIIYGKAYPTVYGKLVLVGKPELLNFIVNAGLGNCTGSGLGMLEVVKSYD